MANGPAARGIEQIPWLYDAIFAVGERLGFARWRHELVRAPRGRVLEIGSGTGRNLPLYASDARVVGLDLVLDSLRAARARSPQTLLLAASVEELPFKADSFDAVVSSLVFCSVPHPPRGFAEIARVLRPGGRLHMLEHVRASAAWLARLQDRITPAWKKLTGGCHPNRDTEAAVREAGFRIAADDYRASTLFRRFVADPPQPREGRDRP